jgi:HipA-like kinase
MIRRLRAAEYNRAMKSGKTAPALITCVDANEQTVEVVAKFSAGCERREAGLAMEVIAACLAGDLGLPVPEPFVLDLPQAWIDVLPDESVRARINASSRVAFGSRLLSPQYSLWHSGVRMLGVLVQPAADIFAFDAWIQNPDRRMDNPNCLIRGDQLRIIDHELAFSHGLILGGWTPPWELGGLKSIETPGNHIFLDRLRGRQVDYVTIRQAWAALTDAQVTSYGDAVPQDWAVAAGSVQTALRLIRDVRDNIDDCIKELERVLT